MIYFTDKSNTRGFDLLISHMSVQNRQFSIFGGVILPAFNINGFSVVHNDNW